MTGAHPALGVTLTLLVALAFATMDTLTRFLGGLLPVLLILTVRYAVQALGMAAWLARTPARLRPRHPRFQIVRGALLLATSVCTFYGVQHVPVPEFTAIFMLSPVLVTLLAALWLGERVSPWRWVLVAGGFAGVLIVIRPGSGLFGWAVLYPLGGAACYALFQALTRKLAALEDPLTTHFWTGLVGAIVLLPVLLASPLDVHSLLAAAPPAHWALLLGIALLGSSGHLVLIYALGMAPASKLMPFIYVQIAFAAAWGWVLFGHWPDAWAWAGMALISACGAATVWLNLRPAPVAAQRPGSSFARSATSGAAAERAAPATPAIVDRAPTSG
jgi:drug/metabolite transporter (DMT)-like permease